MRVMSLKLVTIRLAWNKTAGLFSNLFAEIVRLTSQKNGSNAFQYDND